MAVLLMFRRLARAVRIAAKEDDFAPVFGAALLLVLAGTLTYTLANDWSLADGFYFAVATLTTSSIANPDLTIDSAAMEVFTAFYVLVGIGILVEVVRRIGAGFVKVRQEDQAHRQARRSARKSSS
jgi:hypothetical protein